MNRPFTLIVFFLTFIYTATCAENPQHEKGHKGVLDLRKVDLSQSIITLEGEWAFYWKQLYDPKHKPLTKPQYFYYPSLWTNLQINGKSLTSEGYCTYELMLLLPHDRPAMSIEAPDAYSSFSLYVNDSLLLQNGRPGSSKENSIPFWRTSSSLLMAGADTFHLFLQVANFWHSKGGTNIPLKIAKVQTMVQIKDREMAFDLVLSGCLFMGGLFFLGLYCFGRRDLAILYFSLFCLFFSYRMVGTDRYVLHTLFPNLSWFVTIRLEYFSLAAGVAMFTLYTRLLFPEDSNKRIMQVLAGFSLIYSFIILVTPPKVFTSFLTIYLFTQFIISAYSVYIYLQAVRHKRTGSIYAFTGIILMLVISVISNLHFFGLIAPFTGIIFCCYIAFFLLQSFAISHRFALTFRTATLEAQQGLKTKSEFLSTMSHEIRTPLNAVIGMTHVLMQKQPRPDQQEHLDVLLFSATNLLSIVNNILDYSKIEAGKISFENISMDIGAIARNITVGLKSSITEKDISLRLELDELLPERVMGDPTRLSQVINNLMQNAIKFTKEGWVCLRIDVANINNDGVTLNISVEDTGIGIAIDKLDLIFERFSQAESSTSRSYGEQD